VLWLTLSALRLSHDGEGAAKDARAEVRREGAPLDEGEAVRSAGFTSSYLIVGTASRLTSEATGLGIATRGTGLTVGGDEGSSSESASIDVTDKPLGDNCSSGSPTKGPVIPFSVEEGRMSEDSVPFLDKG